MAAQAHSNYLIRGKSKPKPRETLAELGHDVGKNFCRDMYSEESCMLICDDCEEGFHVRCVGLKKVPRGEWRCPACK